MKKGVTVCHLTVLHFRYDLRIVIRECLSLIREGYDVHYILSDGRGDEVFEQLQIHDLGISSSTIERLTKTHYLCLRKALALNADVYHFHDPELLFLGLILKLLGKNVIADIHEDVPNQFKGNIKKNIFRRHLSSIFISRLEKWIFPFFDAVITASPFVESKLRSYAKRIVNIGCFPDLRREFLYPKEVEGEKYDLVYTGSISRLRGIIETLEMLEHTDISFALAGDFQGKNLENQLIQMNAWKNNTSYLGYIENRADYIDLLFRSKVGLTTLKYNLNFQTIYCVKMFEYMAAGIPQIATDFEQWKEWFERYDCMIFVNPSNKNEVKEAINFLLENRKEVERMGINARKAVEQVFNWQAQEKKLYDLYEQVLN